VPPPETASSASSCSLLFLCCCHVAEVAVNCDGTPAQAHMRSHTHTPSLSYLDIGSCFQYTRQAYARANSCACAEGDHRPADPHHPQRGLRAVFLHFFRGLTVRVQGHVHWRGTEVQKETKNKTCFILRVMHSPNLFPSSIAPCEACVFFFLFIEPRPCCGPKVLERDVCGASFCVPAGVR